MPASVVATASAALSASRSPSVTFSGYVPFKGDMVILFPSSTTNGHTLTEPSDWVAPANGAAQSDAHQLCCIFHFTTDAEVSAGTTTYTATNLYGATTTGNVVAVVLRGVHPNEPVEDIWRTWNDGNTTTPHVITGLGAITRGGGLVVSCVAKDGTGAYSSAPAGWTTQVTSNTNQGKWCGIRDALTVAGVSVPDTNITPSAGDEFISVSLAVVPMPPPPLANPTTQAVRRSALF